MAQHSQTDSKAYYWIGQFSIPHIPTSLSGQIRKFHPIIKVIIQSQLLASTYSPGNLKTDI